MVARITTSDEISRPVDPERVDHRRRCLEERVTAPDGCSTPEPEDVDAEVQYVWGERYIDDLLLRDRDTTGNGTLNERLYAVQDVNWNVVALANSSGAVQERFIYSAYGTPSVLNADFTEKTTGTGFDWEFLFTGRRLDGESGLMYYRHRYYHAGVGRFINRDPAESNVNLYHYVANRPTIAMDPLGLDHEYIALGIEGSVDLVFHHLAPPPVGRDLTIREKRFLWFVFGCILDFGRGSPGYSSPEVRAEIRSDVSHTLNRIRLWDLPTLNVDPTGYASWASIVLAGKCIGVTFGDNIFFKHGHYPTNTQADDKMAVVAHEVFHAIQYRRSGMSIEAWIADYAVEGTGHSVNHFDRDKGYRAISEEIEAFSLEGALLAIFDKYPNLPNKYRQYNASCLCEEIRQEYTKQRFQHCKRLQ